MRSNKEEKERRQSTQGKPESGVIKKSKAVKKIHKKRTQGVSRREETVGSEVQLNRWRLARRRGRANARLGHDAER